MLFKSFFKNNLFILSTLIFCSAQFDAYGWNGHDDADDRKAPRRTDFVVARTGNAFQDDLPSDILKLIFAYASKAGADPRNIERVCKNWYMSMRYRIPEAGAPAFDRIGIPYTSKMNDHFMEDCMKSYMESIVSNGVLYYKKGQAGKEQVLRFENGTANLVDCEGQGDKQVYTLSEERLNTVRGTNEDRVVTYFGPFHKTRHLLPADAEGTVSDVVVIWKWGNDKLWEADVESSFDYLIIRPSRIGAVNMYENWGCGLMGGLVWRMGGDDAIDFSCSFVNPD